MKRKTKKQRLAIAKKAAKTKRLKIQYKIERLENSLQTKDWKLEYIAQGTRSDISEWHEMIKIELAKWFPVWPAGTMDNPATITSTVLPYFNRQLRDSYFNNEVVKYSYEWWLIDTGRYWQTSKTNRLA